MAISFLRTVILYFAVMVVIRLMGKRQVSQLTPAELVVTIMMSELASIPMQETGVPLFAGLLPISTIFVLEIAFSLIGLKSKSARRFLGGKPSVLIHNGNILLDEMARIRFDRDDLMEELRLAGYANIKDIQYAILETNGQLSVFPNKAEKPLTQKDIAKINKPER